MDKTTSFRCVKYALVAGNATVLVLGVTGFILGLIDPPFIQVYDPEFQDSSLYPVDYGPQLALVSCIAVVIACAGLIGALREHFYLLLVYALCIVLVFIFRLAWWATSTLHQEKRFILDLTVSLTLLTVLGKFFLLVLAILEALTIQNSLPLTKQKFQMLKSKLQARQARPKDHMDSSKTFPPKAKPRPKGKPSPADNIYITSSSIYGSGRRRSPVRMNGHDSSHRSSSRARKYLPGVGYSSHSPQSSDSSHDSNNNKNTSTQTQNVSLNTKSDQRDSPVVIDNVEQHRVPKNLASDHYYRFQSPSPSTPTSTTYSRPANQPFFVTSQFDHSHKGTSSLLSPTISEPRSVLFSPPSSRSSTLPPPSSAASSRLTSTSPTPRPTHYSSSSTLLTSTRPIITSNTTSGYSTSYSRAPEPTTTSYSSNRPSTLFGTKWTTPATSTPTTSVTTSKDYKTQRANFFTSPPATYNTTNLFNYSSMRSTAATSQPSIYTTTTTAPASNLNQTRNLFSTYTSPLSATTAVSKPATPLSPPFSSSYRSTPITRSSITSPAPTPRATKSPLTAASSSPLSQVPISTISSSYQPYRGGPIAGSGAASSGANTTTSHYRSLLSASSPSVSAVPPATTTATSTSSTSTLFSRLYPKSYEDYVKSYRYPTSEQNTSRSSTTNTRPSYTTATLPHRRAMSPTSPQPRRTTSSDRTMESYSSMTRSGSMGADLETTTTYLTTTTQHRQMTERESVFYKQTVRES